MKKILKKILTKKKKKNKINIMAKDITLFKGSYSVKINELQLENFINLGYKLESESKTKPKTNKDKSKWQHTTEKKES